MSDAQNIFFFTNEFLVGNEGSKQWNLAYTLQFTKCKLKLANHSSLHIQ